MPKPSIIVIARDLDPHLRNTLEKVLSQIPIKVRFIARHKSQVHGQEANATVASKINRRIRTALSLIARGRFHLKHSGVRQSTRTGMSYLFQRSGREWFFSNRNNTCVTNEDLLAALTILQRDLRVLQSNLTQPHFEVKEPITRDEDTCTKIG